MFCKSPVVTAAIVVLGLLIRSCSASDPPPPACVITCLNEEKGVSLNDLEHLCASSKVQECFSRLCGGEEEEAKNVYKETCKTGGYNIAIVVSSSASSSPTTTSENMESFPSVTADPTASGSGSGSPTSTSTTGSASSLSITGYAFALIAAVAGILL